MKKEIMKKKLLKDKTPSVRVNSMIYEILKSIGWTPQKIVDDFIRRRVIKKGLHLKKDKE